MQNQSYKALLKSLAVLAISCFAGIASAQDTKVTINTGDPDGKVGALSVPASLGQRETETADDFNLRQMTVISGASIVGVIPAGTPLSNITNVEVEFYHVFPVDSNPQLSGNVPSRANSPSDNEIGSATRDSSKGTLAFRVTPLNASFTVDETVINGIHKLTPGGTTVTHGEGPETGQEVRIDITFTIPVILPADNYFFRPEVQVTDGRFLFVSAPRPIVAPGILIPGDKQAWIRNFDLKPDWLRIGTDIIAGTPPTFNMTFSLTGNAILAPGTPGHPNCDGQTISGLAQQFGGIDAAASTLGFPSVDSLHQTFGVFCAP
ncbi:MAG TPA: hypothetical protein VKD70_18565 [Candidatus Acidoferrum sp.]|nr:hypothetical protein [Candidatus Acidoferrum sp.]